MSDDGLIGKGPRQIARDERADELRRRAWELIKAQGTGSETGVLEYTNVGMTIRHILVANTHRLSIMTNAKKVLAVEWDSDSIVWVLCYEPGLWETKLRHLTRGAL